MRTKQTARKSSAGSMRLKKDKQTKTIAQVNFTKEVSARTQDNKTFRRREDVMIKSYKYFIHVLKLIKGGMVRLP